MIQQSRDSIEVSPVFTPSNSSVDSFSPLSTCAATRSCESVDEQSKDAILEKPWVRSFDIFHPATAMDGRHIVSEAGQVRPPKTTTTHDHIVRVGDLALINVLSGLPPYSNRYHSALGCNILVRFVAAIFHGCIVTLGMTKVRDEAQLVGWLTALQLLKFGSFIARTSHAPRTSPLSCFTSYNNRLALMGLS